MFREQFKLVEITPFECVSSTQNSCRKTMLNVEAAIERLVMSTNKCACSTSFLFVRFTHKSMCYSNKPLIGVEPTNRVCEYGPRSPTHFFVLDQLTLFNIYGKVWKRNIKISLEMFCPRLPITYVLDSYSARSKYHLMIKKPLMYAFLLSS